MTTFQPGDLVRVGPAYVGSGRFAPDGHEGLHTVVKYLAPDDYKLARGAVDAATAEWDVIVHVTRLERAAR